MSKRKLTPKEIEYVLDFIQPNVYIPKDTADVIVFQTKQNLSKQIKEVEIYPKLLEQFKKQIKNMYFSTLIQPGESVGIITAQSIGEKQTQSNLNSVEWGEKIIYKVNNRVEIEPIGQFIDRYLEKYGSKVVKYPENRTEYLDLSELDLKIPSCDENGFCDWYKIEAATRHLPEGKLVLIKTKSGRKTIVTRSKSLLIWDGEHFSPKNGSDVKIGDIIPTTRKLPILNGEQKTISLKNFNIELNTLFGAFLGFYLACGVSMGKTICFLNKSEQMSILINNFSEQYGLECEINSEFKYIKINCPELALFIKNNCGTSCRNKTIPLFCFSARENFISSLINNYLSVEKNKFFSENLVYGFSTLLNHFGIFCSIKTEKSYFLLNFKSEENMDVFSDPIVLIEDYVSNKEYVYDFTVEKTRNFQLWNGINVRDTFHKAGSSEKQPVVSKFSELLNATNKPKASSYLIYFKEGNSSVSELRKTIGHSIVELTLKRVVKKWIICKNKEEDLWYRTFYILYQPKPKNLKHCIRVELDMDVLFEYNLTLKEISERLLLFNDIFCVFSPDNYAIIDIYFNTDTISLPEKKLLFVTEENAIEIYLEEVAQPTIETVSLCGICGVTNMFFIQDGKEWLIETENSKEKIFIRNSSNKKKDRKVDTTQRFKKVLAHPDIDMSRTLSNNVWDIYHAFGIEATRQYMIDEFTKIMEGINLCHVMLLVEKMTFTGTISSISRYTMRQEESGPFGKASFEETLDNFLKAGVFGQEEPTKGVSASIICGKRASMGTGLCELTMDMEKLVPIIEESVGEEEN